MLARMWRKGNPLTLLVIILIGTATMENSMVVSEKKKKMEPPYDQEVSFLGIYPKKTKSTTLKRYIHPNVHSSIIYNSQDMEAA